ncbi:NAD-dependent protein deacetylase hst2-2 [Aspergillus pseudoustus]|uniref:NAD-dependent protein deacetylase n=1 Tax=Aspergillus pseudoustus TaxID=1810923 RepID=A0ABR4JAC1_9EURO
MATPREPTPPSPSLPSNSALDTLITTLQSGGIKNILVLAGAGLSTSAGIPDFRTPTSGLYAKLAPLQLPYPEALFHINYFRHTPEPFYALARARHPKNAKPTLAHAFLALLEKKGVLRFVVTQNIDSLEGDAGVSKEKVLNAHGSWNSQRCVKCKTPFDDGKMKAAIRAGEVPLCEKEADGGSCGGIVKPDIVMFGESLPRGFDDIEETILPQADLVIVMGTSLKVAPVSGLPRKVKDSVPRVLINKEVVGDFGARKSDICLLGDCDEGVREIARRLGWEGELEDLHREAIERKERTVREEGWDDDDNSLSLDECIARAAEKMKVRMGVSDGHRRMLEGHLGKKMASMLRRGQASRNPTL